MEFSQSLTRQITSMPTRNKFMMAFPLEYLLLHLSGANAKKPPG